MSLQLFINKKWTYDWDYDQNSDLKYEVKDETKILLSRVADSDSYYLLLKCWTAAVWFKLKLFIVDLILCFQLPLLFHFSY